MSTCRITLSNVQTSETLFPVPDGITCIGEEALQGCGSLNRVTIPDSVTTIEDGAFLGCPNLTIHTPKGSYAKRYAAERSIPTDVLSLVPGRV